MRLEYIVDGEGSHVLQDKEGIHQVMMDWEKPYMEKCIEVLNPEGSVLEIGFGMGFSARKICSCPGVTEYTVIECSPQVWPRVEEMKREFPHITINLVRGRWEDVLCTVGHFDSCFFDDYDLSPIIARFPKFLCEFMSEHGNVGTKVGVYSTTNVNIPDVDCLTFTNISYDIDIPKHCKYARGNKMFIPIITKVGEVDDNFEETMTKQRKYACGKLNGNVKFKAVM